MNPEKAQELLRGQKLADAAARRASRIRRLSGAAGRTAGQLAEEQWWQLGRAVEEMAGPRVEALSPDDRIAALSAIEPGLGAYLARAWQDGIGRPYQIGLTRKAFRAPRDPAVSLPARHARLVHVLGSAAGYEPDPVWLVRWAPYVAPNELGDSVGGLLASVLDAGGPVADEVFDVLVASAEGEDEIGAMGRHVSRALLTASRPDGWDFIERLLLAAQRQEGLRQAILEAVDEAHPEAFRRMLRLIVDKDLLRFPAAVRAVDVWFGFQWGAAGGRGLADVLARVSRFLDDGEMRAAALRSGTAEDVFLALWCNGFEDAPGAVPTAESLLYDPASDAERRYAAVHFLAQTALSSAVTAVVPALDDEDLRVAARALDALLSLHGRREVAGAAPDTFDRAERLLERLPKASVTLEPIVWPWTGRTLERQTVAGALVTYAGNRPAERLMRHLASMDPGSRTVVAMKLAMTRRPTPEVRRALVSLAGDPAVSVRNAVLSAVQRMDPTDDEAAELEGLLRRKAGDLRRAIVGMLVGRGPDRAVASAERLLTSTDGQQRLGGLEILRRLVESGKAVRPARELARTYLDRVGEAKIAESERTQLAAILGEQAAPASAPLTPEAAVAEPDAALDEPPLPVKPTLVDGLGLLDHTRRTLPRPIARRDVAITSDAAFAILAELDRLADEHRGEPVTIETWTGTEEKPLGELVREFPAPPGGQRIGRAADTALAPDPAAIAADLERERARFPLADVWEGFLASRGPALRDPDGLELARAQFVPVVEPAGYRGGPYDAWTRQVDALTGGGREPLRIRYHNVTATVATWLVVLHPPAGLATFLLDVAETLLGSIPAGTNADGDNLVWSRDFKPGWRDDRGPWLMGLRTARQFRRMRPDLWSAEDAARLWSLERWVDEGGRTDLGAAVEAAQVFGATSTPPADRGFLGGLFNKLRVGKVVVTALARPARRPPPIEELVAAYRAGVATDADLIDSLIGPGSGGLAPWASFRALAVLGTRNPPLAGGDERLLAVIDRVRRRIVDVELRRGEEATEASKAALALQYSGGLDTLIRLVRALGTEPFVRGWSYDGESRQVVFSRLIRATMPGPDDARDAFGPAFRAAGIPERRIVELACYAPQWAEHAETALGWPGLASATWWLHAHTKDPSWVVGNEVREAWTAAVAERTPLAGADLVEGAVDVGWFRAAYEELGAERWKVLDAAAKYGSTGGGHTRAQLFANAMRGSTSDQTILKRIAEKRHQDSVRALGLVPLPDGAGRDEVLLSRYRALQEFIRTSRQFGSARQASEKRAAEIGLQNLARTAGYADPIRLGWAMEARGVADLADGPLVASLGDVEVSLAIDDRGQPDVVVRRGGTVLKAVPAAAKKSKEVSALRSRATDLRRQASRMRRSLEDAMIRGDAFSGAELVDLAKHPLLAPQLRRLVLLGDGIAGYPIADGRALADASGREHAVGASESVRIAHPVDLLEAGAEAWHGWQRDAFRREIVQPFKQVFRELYPPTAAELAEGGAVSRRYAGHQVGPRQAFALLSGRGWVSRPEEAVRRTFHDIRLSAELWFLEPFFSPADVDGLTLELVRFTRSVGDREEVPIAEVPRRVFSEVMRDLDLVVSVAHAGGVDPEASASTVEMRAALVAETCRVLEMPNVTLDPPRALIDGSLGEYSVHLGSAVVHRRPGGALFIVPVHAQSRGRLFLPFADDDPKTAEVLAKVLLLARDKEIRDPSILDQIRTASG